MKNHFFQMGLAAFLLASSLASAAPKSVRWTAKEDKNASLPHVLDVIRGKTGVTLSLSNLMTVENRALANNHFLMMVPTAASVPIKGQSIRIWTGINNGEIVQVEAVVDQPPAKALLDVPLVKLTSQETMAIVQRVVKQHSDDNQLRTVDWQDAWDAAGLVRVVKVKGKHGTHHITIAHAGKRVLENTYREFPQLGGRETASEFNIPVLIYPIYEEIAKDRAKNLLPRIESELRYVKSTYPNVTSDPYGPLKTQAYTESKYDPYLGLTEEGRKQGFWAMSYIKMLAGRLLAAVTPAKNSFSEGGVFLEGRYATVSLHPEVANKFKLGFTPRMSGMFKPDWKPSQSNPNSFEMIPGTAVRGRPLMAMDEARNRTARRLEDHDPSTYINDGFDEVQVYWAVNQMFDSLRPMGFTDPDLSTRPFNAFLYDPDITYRDNAFYTDDTINFTTYSSKTQNMARDNSTIWHELGHGVMDRLMGDYIVLADTGGLSEGMADYVAQLVLNDVTKGNSYPGKENLRIFNNTGFYLTNEVHDDGEAYGGTMNDFLRAVMRDEGQGGLTKVSDLTLEAMRLCRNHPGLTAPDWFNHMLFADELGNEPVRKAGELRKYLLTSLAGRNFHLDGAEVAKFTILNGDKELTSTGPGSRENPIKVKLAAEELTKHQLRVSLKGTADYQFKYPVTVKVQYTGGPLQGAIHWTGKEASPQTYTLASESDSLPLEISAVGKCDEINRPDNSCVDFAYIQIWNSGETARPQAKKRFYLRIYPK